MMRSWKYQWDAPVTGLRVDTLAYQFMEKFEYRDKSFTYYGLAFDAAACRGKAAR